MLGSGRTVISVPAHDLRAGDIAGSVFEAADLQRMPMPEDLRRAFELVLPACKKPLCMIRPEIFTHGTARRWLNDRLGAVRNHICLSDGSAIKVIDGLENHVFLFRLDQHRQDVALRNLLSWAPEIFTQLRSQINTFHGATLDGRLLAPPTTLLFPKTPISGPDPEFFEFSVSNRSGQEGARLIIDRGAVEGPKLIEFSAVHYIPMTESSAHDPAFSKDVAQKIATAYFNPDQCVLIRLPAPHEHVPDLLHQITVTLEAVRGLGIVMPKVPARNIFLLRDDVPESFFDAHHGRVSFMFDASFDFWRYTQALYQRLHGVTYWLGSDRGRLKSVVQSFTGILGQLPSGRRPSSAMAPVVLHWSRTKSASQAKHDR